MKRQPQDWFPTKEDVRLMTSFHLRMDRISTAQDLIFEIDMAKHPTQGA